MLFWYVLCVGDDDDDDYDEDDNNVDDCEDDVSCVNRSVALYRTSLNSPFPSCLKPLYQSKAWCTTIHMKMSLS